jgi:hypothetical protein
VFDITDPAAPVRVTTTDANDYSGGAVAMFSDSVAVVNSNVLNLKNVDVEFPAFEPAAIAGEADLKVEGPYIYTLSSGQLDVFEVAPGEVRFVGRHPGVGGASNTGAIAVDRGRVYFTGGTNTSITMVDLHSGEGTSRIGVEPESVGSNHGVLFDNLYVEGFGRMGPADRVGYLTVGSSFFVDLERFVVDGNIGALGARDFTNGDRLLANVFTRSVVEGALATGFTGDTGKVSSVSMEDTVGGSVALAWPWLITASRNNTTTAIVLEVYDLRSATEDLHDTLTIVSSTSSTGCRVEPNAIAVHRGFVYVAVDNDTGSSNTCAGLYRGTFNGRTGVITEATATKVITDDTNGVAGVAVVGTRLASWRDIESGSNAEISMHHFSTTANSDAFPASPVALTGTVSAFNQREVPVFVGEYVFGGRTALFQFSSLGFGSSPGHTVASATVISSTPITNGRSITVAGDTLYIQQEDRLLEVHRLR